VEVDRRVWLESRALRDAGYRVTVICPKARGTKSYSGTQDGIRILRYPWIEARVKRGAFLFEFLWCWLWTLLLTMRARLSGRFDVIHACNPPDTFFAIALLWRPWRVRFIFDQHDLCPELYVSKYPQREGDAMHRMTIRFERWTYRSAHAVIVTNESFREIAIRRGDIAPDRIFVVRSGPDAERIRESPLQSGDRPEARFVLGYLGTMSTQDGVDGLLRVVDQIVNGFGRKDVHQVIVGDGPLLEEMRGLSVRMGLERFVTFTGRIPDGEKFCRTLRATDLCVSPDPLNPLNDLCTMNKTLEYMAFGRPVVAYALKETMYSGGDAVVYARPGDEEDMARKIVELLDDPARREEMSRRGRARIREKLAWERSVPHLYAAYERAFSGTLSTPGSTP
jgi:glycosyltransferase involved in cell wall biosynthesis